jgi:hypothetical protein
MLPHLRQGHITCSMRGYSVHLTVGSTAHSVHHNCPSSTEPTTLWYLLPTGTNTNSNHFLVQCHKTAAGPHQLTANIQKDRTARLYLFKIAHSVTVTQWKMRQAVLNIWNLRTVSLRLYQRTCETMHMYARGTENCHFWLLKHMKIKQYTSYCGTMLASRHKCAKFSTQKHDKMSF